MRRQGIAEPWDGVRSLRVALEVVEPDVCVERCFLSKDGGRIDPMDVVAHSTLEEVSMFFRSVKWAWPGWIPKGHLTMIVGPQGVGKSYFAAYLMGALSGHIAEWPDGAPIVEPRRLVLLLDTEEFRGEYAQRLAVMSVPMEQVIIPGRDPTEIPRIPRDLGSIRALAIYKRCAGIVIDSLSGAHGLEENSANMRAILQALVQAAGELKLPVIVVHHTRKRNPLERDEITLDRVRGSSTITQFCRSVIGLQRVGQGRDAAVRVESLKNSFAAPPEPVAFRISDAGLRFCELPDGAAPASVIDQAMGFLKNELADGPVQLAELLIKSESHDLSRSSLYRARRRLGVVASRGWWALPQECQ